MQKYHSFLKRMKGNLSNLFSIKIGGCKKATISVAYILATTLVVLSPDSIYGTEVSAISRAQFESKALIEEETENAAIIKTNPIKDYSESEGIQLLQVQEKKSETNQILLKETKETYNENHLEAFENQADIKASNTEELVKKEGYNLIDKEAANKAADYKKQIEEEEAAKEAERIASEKRLAEEKAAKEAAEKKAAKEAAEKKAAEEKAAKEAAEKEAAEKKAAEEKAAKEAAEKKAAEEKASSTNSSKYSNKEIEILERIVEAEATGEDVKSKILVANVVLNRVKHKRFPNSIEGVVFQNKQFSPIRDGRYYSVSVTSSTKEAVERAIEGEDYSQGALYFAARKRANKKSMRWFDKNLDNLFAYGGHEFFK